MTNAATNQTATETKTEAKLSGLPIKAAVQDVLKTIEDFGALLRRETEALKAMDYRLVDLLQADKKNYARRYSDMVTELSTRRDDMATLDVSMRERLIKARTTFTIILNDNMRALETSRDSTRRLVDRILDTARRAVADDTQTGYSAKGASQSYKTSTLSLSMDRSL